MRLVVLILLFACSLSWANPKVSSEKKDTIAFISHKNVEYSEVWRNQQIASSGGGYIKWVVGEVPAEEIESLLAKLKSHICRAVDNAHIKTWFSFDANAKLIAVSANAGTGLEVTFDCKAK